MLTLLLATTLQLPVETQRTARHLARSLKWDSVDQSAAARSALWIDPKGKVRDCKLVGYVGDLKFAQQLCDEIIGAKFKPAQDSSGVAVHSLYTMVLGASEGSGFKARTGVSWLSEPAAPKDFAIILEAIPKELAFYPRVEVSVQINESGDVEACKFTGDRSQTYAPIACEQVTMSKFERLRSRDGQPVTYVRNLIVAFETDS